MSINCDVCSMEIEEETMQLHLFLVHNITESKVCPFCPFSTTESTSLEEHVVNVHRDELKTPEKDTTFIPGCSHYVTSEERAIGPMMQACPLCDEIFPNDILPTHVESHYLSDTGNVSSESILNLTQLQTKYDAELAKEIEMKELERLEEEERNQLAAETLQLEMLQEEHHNESSDKHSFQTQALRTMDQAVGRQSLSIDDYFRNKFELLEGLSRGEDDYSTCTRMLSKSLCDHMDALRRPNDVYLISSAFDHFGRGYGDTGWGCGYRNIQMLLSSIPHLPLLSQAFPQFKDARIPSIPEIQQIIESAWLKGFDPPGKEQLGNKLLNTRKWIGATEAFCFFASLGFHCRIIDFRRYSDQRGKSHPNLFNWVLEYFKFTSSSSDDEQCTFSSAAEGSVRRCDLPILYLQQEGHSRSIVGVKYDTTEKRATHLIVADPSHTKRYISQVLGGKSGKVGSTFIQSLASFNLEQYQIVVVVGSADAARFERQKDVQTIGENVF